MSTSRTTLVQAYSPITGGIRIGYDGNGQVLYPGHTTLFTLPYGATIKSWQLKADNIGSLVIATWASAVVDPPTIANNIAGSNPIALSNEIKHADLILSGWSPGLVANTNFLLTVVSCTDIRWAELIFNLERN